MVVSSVAVLDALRMQAPEFPPETGGILGGREGVVTDFLPDKGMPDGAPCSYTPDTAFLNHAIAEWAEQGIDFMGIYHVHFGGAETLSLGDREYIFRIMRAMPGEVRCLYFPLVVMPLRKVIVYKAEDSDGEFTIEKDEIEYQGGI